MVSDIGEDHDVSGLLGMLRQVEDRRGAQGRVHELSFVLAVSLVAVLGGASSFRQIADRVADVPQSLLGKLGARWCHFRGGYRWPSKSTIIRVLQDIDADALDRVVGAWLAERAERGTDGVWSIAIDGKVLRGAWTARNGQFTLFSAMTHQDAVTIAQVEVPADTNEITQVTNLLDGVRPAQGRKVVVTMDAAHTQRGTAGYVAGERGFDYVMTAKGNQPTLLDAVSDTCVPLTRNKPDHVVEERGHGRINRWSTWITDATGIDFPHIQQAGLIRREEFNLAGRRVSSEYARIITSSSAENMSAAALHHHVRNHWAIENKSHYVRDTTWAEDANQTYVGSAPHVLATLKNTAASLLRLNGFDQIKRTTEWIAGDRNRALPPLAT